MTVFWFFLLFIFMVIFERKMSSKFFFYFSPKRYVLFYFSIFRPNVVFLFFAQTFAQTSPNGGAQNIMNLLGAYRICEKSKYRARHLCLHSMKYHRHKFPDVSIPFIRTDKDFAKSNILWNSSEIIEWQKEGFSSRCPIDYNWCCSKNWYNREIGRRFIALRRLKTPKELKFKKSNNKRKRTIDKKIKSFIFWRNIFCA